MSNPTSNYSFQMPTSADLVTDLPADFEVFGQAVDTQMKTNANASTQKSTFTTKGDIYVATAASTPARLGVGSNGQVLMADSAETTGLKWATAGASGTIKQVVTGSYNTLTSTTSSTAVDTGLSLSITPTASTSKILVLIAQSFGYYLNTDGQAGVVASLWRNSTQINDDATMAYAVMKGPSGSETRLYVRSGFWYYDSPATTSAVTYKTMFNQRNTCTAYANRDATSYITLMEIGA
jgi:hypothetical protein